MKFAADTLSYYWRRARFLFVHKVLHADDPPQSLAMGIAIGIFVAFLPLFGKTLLCLGLAWMLRANKAVGIPLVWISNPLTAVPMYYPGYRLGCKLLAIPASNQWKELIKFSGDWQTTWQNLSDSFNEFVLPLCVGSLLISLLISTICYFVSLKVIEFYRMRRWGQLMPPRKAAPSRKQKPSENVSLRTA